jgi:hypothetical protein
MTLTRALRFAQFPALGHIAKNGARDSLFHGRVAEDA